MVLRGCCVYLGVEGYEDWGGEIVGVGESEEGGWAGEREGEEGGGNGRGEGKEEGRARKGFDGLWRGRWWRGGRWAVGFVEG